MARQMDIKHEDNEFLFTRKWFLNRNLPTFREIVYPEWHGKPITYLELGVFEGMSITWMCQHVIYHPEARAVGVDPWLMTTKLDENFMQDCYLRACHNTRVYPQCRLQRGNSAEVLRKMNRRGHLGITKDSVDVCMVDGNHNALAVLDDLRWVYPLVKVGGWIMLDDVVNDQPKKDHVQEGLDMWLGERNQPVEQAAKHRYMEIYRKLEG